LIGESALVDGDAVREEALTACAHLCRDPSAAVRISAAIGA